MHNLPMTVALTEVAPLVSRICRRRITQGDRAQDAAQDTMVSLWRWLASTPEARVSDIRPVATRIATRRCVDQHRAIARLRLVDLDADPEGPDSWEHLPGRRIVATDPAEQTAAVLFVAGLLAGLTAYERRILWYRVVCGAESAEVAATLGTTAGAVRKCQSVALARLRELAVAS